MLYGWFLIIDLKFSLCVCKNISSILVYQMIQQKRFTIVNKLIN